MAIEYMLQSIKENINNDKTALTGCLFYLTKICEIDINKMRN